MSNHADSDMRGVQGRTPPPPEASGFAIGGHRVMRISPLSPHAGSLIKASQNAPLEQLLLEPIQAALKSTGTVFFQGFAADLEEFEAFTNRFSDDYMDNTGSGSYRATAEKASDGTIQNVAYNYGVKQQRTFGLPLHADRAYVKTQPELIWFLCRRPAQEKGLTFVCDGVQIYERLSTPTRELFETKRLKYVRNYPDGEWQIGFHTRDLEQVKAYCAANDLQLEIFDDGSLRTAYYKSAVVPRTRFGGAKAFVNSILIQHWQEESLGRKNALVRMEDDSRIPSDALDEVKSVSAALTENLPWQSGDFVMVDNTRMMHGREEFSDPNREVYVRMCRSVSW
jgi:alpha-ketoglutarate-dependent taurine dioxygenase